MTPEEQAKLESKLREAKNIREALLHVDKLDTNNRVSVSQLQNELRVDQRFANGDTLKIAEIEDKDLIQIYSFTIKYLVEEQARRLRKKYEAL